MATTKLSELLKQKQDHKTSTKPAREERADILSTPIADVGYRSDTSITKKQTFKEIDPARCRPWAHHNRSSLWLNKDRCGSLIESIKKDGQQEFGLVRVVRDDPNIDFEIIYGVRRWWSCSQIEGRKFKAKVTSADDQECARLMHLENAESKDISDFERACSFKRQLDLGVFPNKTSLAECLDVSNALVTRMYKAASIMEFDFLGELLENYILDIPIKQASDLYELLLDDASASKIKLAAARMKKGDGGIHGGSGLIRDLIKSAREDIQPVDEVLMQHNGVELVSLKRSKAGKTTITINKRISRIKKDGLKDDLKKVFSDLVEEML